MLAEAQRALAPQLGEPEGPPQPLDGGITNRNYRLRWGGGDVVLRLPGKDTELALGRAGDEHLGLTGPDLLLDRHKLDVQLPCHASYSSCA